MSKVRLMLASAGGAVLLLSGLAAAASPYPPPTQGSAQIVPSRIQPGECAVFSGDGFAPLVVVAVTDDGNPAGSTRSTGSGTFQIRLCFSTDSSRGRHVIAGSGQGADGNALTVSAILIIEGASQTPDTSGPVLLPDIGVVPGSGSAAGSGPVIVQTVPDLVTGPNGGPAAGGVQAGPPQRGPGNSRSGNSGIGALTFALAGLAAAFGASILLLLPRGGIGKWRARPDRKLDAISS